MNLAIFQSIMILTQKGLIEGLWIKTFNVSIWIPLHQSHKPKAMFPKTIPDNVPKNHLRKPKAPLLENIPKTLPSSTITQSNVPENLSSTTLKAMFPLINHHHYNIAKHSTLISQQPQKPNPFASS
jgi:hypothetical protein